MVVHHNNPMWLEPPNPFAHIKGVTVERDDTLGSHQWRAAGGKVKDITIDTPAQVRKLSMAQPVVSVRVAVMTQATLF